MTDTKVEVHVSLILKGEYLDPDVVTDCLKVSPSRSQRKGEKRKFSSGSEYINKIGLWVYEIKFPSNTISQNVDILLSIFRTKNIYELNGVDKSMSFVDVFIMTNTDEEGEITFDFELTSDNVAGLDRLGLPVVFTTTLINKNILPYGTRDGFILP